MCDCCMCISVADKGVDEVDRHLVIAKQTLYLECSGNIFNVQNNVVMNSMENS